MSKNNLTTYLTQVQNRLADAQDRPSICREDPYRGGLTNLGVLNRHAPADLAKLLEIVRVLQASLDEHYEYALACRHDWSDYDGRDHLRIATSINGKAVLKASELASEGIGGDT